MWISELNTKELTDPAYVAFDDGEDTYKTEFNECVENAANAAVAAADLTENEVAFTSGDAASPTAWSSVPVLASGSTLATLFNRISTMIKNVRWLYSKLGTTDISSIGNGTVTGALSTLNGNSGVQIITLQNATAGGNTSFYYKKGNVVTFFFDLTPNTSGSSVTVFTFPSGFRPSEALRFTLSPVVHDSTEASMGTAFAVIGSSGSVQFYIGSARRVFLSGCFAVN